MGLITKTMIYFNKHNYNLLYKSLVRLHLAYDNLLCSSLLKSEITLTYNVQRRAIAYK